MKRALAGLLLSAVLAAGAAAEPRLRLVEAFEPDKTLALEGAPFGGISGIDYDPASGRWLMVTDDKDAPRFYVGQLQGAALRLDRVVRLLRDDGAPFDAAGERGDAESLRIDPLGGDLVWTTEGDPQRGFDPAIRRMGRDGTPKGEIPLPQGLGFDPSGLNGSRRNQTLEGLTFAPDGRSLWLAMEAPLVQDGPASTLSQTGLARFTRIDRQGRILAQHAYPLDPIQAAPARRGDNGVSEILAVDDHRLLVLERSGVEDARGRFSFHCRLYLVDVRGAEDVAGRTSLKDGVRRPLVKRLLVNFDRLEGVATSNLEAMAWGAPQADGARTLVLMADDNFDPNQRGQVLIFALSL